MAGRIKRLLGIILLTIGIFTTTPLWRMSFRQTLGQRFSGRVLLEQTQSDASWYVNPADQKRYGFRTPGEALLLIRQVGIGVRHSDRERYDVTLPKQLLGRILIDTEDRGNAYYIDSTARLQWLGDPSQALQVLRATGTVVPIQTLEQIPIGRFD